MKNILNVALLLMVLILSACSNGTESELTLQDFIDEFEAEGVSVDSSEKPMYSMIKAKDGVIFYIEEQPVKIYEYASEKDIKDGEEALPVVSEWDKNGRFVLESSNQKAKVIFNNVK